MDAKRGTLNSVHLVLPYPPTVNTYWRRKGNKMFIAKAGKKFLADVLAITSSMNLEKMLGPLSVIVHVFPPDNHRRDLDNLQKGLFDALEKGGVYEDDSQIRKIVLEKREVTKGGKTLVWIERYMEGTDAEVQT